MRMPVNGLFLAAVFTLAGSVMAGDEHKVNLQLTMQTQVNPNALALWEATNKAQDDEGNIDPKKLDASAWSRLLEMGKAIDGGGKALATGPGVIAASPGAALQDESNAGASKAADVQRYLDAKPAEFRKHAAKLQRAGAAIAEAAAKHDFKKLSELANSLDEVCEGCHVVFWYPQQNSGT